MYKCNKEISYQTNIKRHIMIHSREKPYVCKQCSKSFIQSSHLKSHMKTCEEKPKLGLSGTNYSLPLKV